MGNWLVDRMKGSVIRDRLTRITLRSVRATVWERHKFCRRNPRGHTRASAMTPAISVIMPVRNGAEWLAEAVASIRAQDFGDFEFLIVDDGSDDGTAALLSGFAAADHRIRLLWQAPQGIVAALNAAITKARAPYLARIDADDRARADRPGPEQRVVGV